MSMVGIIGNTEADRVLEIARDYNGSTPHLTTNPRMNDAAIEVSNYLNSPGIREIGRSTLMYLFALSFIPRSDIK